MAKHHYRDYILKELERRQRKNPSYSLRAYARDLEVPCSRLSEILNGKVGLSESRAMNLAVKLNLAPSEKDFFVDLALSEHARSAVLREMALKRVQAREEAFEKIGEDQFAIISDWYHTAIAELLNLDQFVATPENMSQRLGLTVDTVEKALERLQNVGLVTKTAEGVWTSSNNKYSSSYAGSSEAARAFYNQMQSKASEAMVPNSGKRWDMGCTLVPTNRDKAKEISQKIRAFRLEIMQELQNSESKNSLFALATSFFEITEQQSS
ncbi:TIGR02147 family protein [Bdellovibrio bacteriovorus]|uniref:TIGR02147 family protein n=1 Tax=Bdellovibrio bacteriovorus TaxID=959 RepID=A0A150WEL2_BDEBC|nr:TIGR02147 family protein [Bdellovibrio bacteriovorus]KYG61312.1 TIGR02147 family protein [Bdellovibrio bacteriovorus]